MVGVARVLLACDEPVLAEEVMSFLDRTGRAKVVAAAADRRQLAEAVRQVGPDVIVATPALAGHVDASVAPMLVMDRSETVGGLRTALRTGAVGFTVWPQDRDGLAGLVASSVSASASDVAPASGPTKVITVTGARGGAGATFLATHLADACARLGSRSLLIDVDPVFGEVAFALGAHRDPEARTARELVPMIDELTPAHVEEVLWSHPRGFRVLLGGQGLHPSHHPGLLAAAGGLADTVIVHAPRSLLLDSPGLLAITDRLLCVLLLDVMSFQCGKRLLDGLEAMPAPKAGLVVNRASRAELVPGDVVRVFGREALAMVPEDRAVAAAQDRGRLLSPRSRPLRVITGLAETLVSGNAPAG